MDWKTELFPNLEYKAYINHASISPLNIRASAAMNALMDRFARVGLNAWKEGAACRKRVREKIGKLIGCSGYHIGLTQNTSHGLVLVANEFPWREGDSLVLLEGEFPGNVAPWLAAARRHSLRVIWLKPLDLLQETAAFKAAMAQKPRLMAVSWVQYQTGYVTPLSLLSRLRDDFNIKICADVIQGLGPLTMNLEDTPLDFVVSGGHKWLLSPEGTGFVYIHPKIMKTMEPALVSWLSQEDPVSFLTRGGGFVDYQKPFRADAQRVEMGTMNNFGYAGMEASLDLYHEVGPAEVSRLILERAGQCRDGLQSLGVETVGKSPYSGNVSFKLKSEALVEAARYLDDKGIGVSTPDGHLRVSAHFFNSEKDIQLYLDEIRNLQVSGVI